MPKDDCLIALLPDWSGRIWFETQDGLVGTVAPDSGEVKTLDLGEEIANSFATDETGGTYVVTTHALYRLSAGPGGAPVVDWRAEYDRGSEQKKGQLSQGSGTTPTIIDGGIVAITDNAEPKMNVAFYERSSGREICTQPVFEDDESATDNSLVSVGDGVIVGEQPRLRQPAPHPARPRTSPGFARVDVRRWRLQGRLDERRDRPVERREGVAGQRPGLRLHEAAELVGRERVVPHRHRRHHRSHRLQRAHRHGCADEQPLRRDDHRARRRAWIATLAGMVRVRDRQPGGAGLDAMDAARRGLT